MKKFLAILFILLGVGLLAYTPLRELYDEYEKNKLIEMYEKNNSNTDGDNNLQGSESEEENISDFYEYFSGLQTIVENRNSSESAENNGDGTTGTNGEDNTEKKEKELKNVMGIINIGKINVKLPIKNYFKEEEIWSSVGHIPGTANPGETGNCVIAGHRARAKGRLFNRLDELEIGDTISITYNSNNFEYKVSEIKIVEPTDVSVLNSNKDEVSLTLITCHPVRVLSHRLIIKAILVP